MLSPKLLFFVFGSFAGILCTLVLVPNHAFSAGNRFSDYLQGDGEDGSSSSPSVDPVLVVPEPQACIVRSEELLRGSAGDPLAGRLQPHLFYLTSGNGAGLTNQVFAAFNLLYLSLLSGRVALAPPFHANHQVQSAEHPPELDISSYFDIPRYLSAVPLAKGVLDWSEIYPDLKSNGSDWERFHDSDQDKKLWPEAGCWGQFVKMDSLRFARIRPTWTPYPPLVASTTDRLISFLQLVPYLLPNSPFAASLASSTPLSSSFLPTLPPNNSFACIDETMAGSDRGDILPMEEIGYGRGSWASVGTHLRFASLLEQEGRKVAAQAFGWGKGVVKPFISLHIRHGDFLSFQCNPDPSVPCWSLPQFAHAVALLQADLVAQGLPQVKDVMVMTDETDTAFLQGIKKLGWKTPKDGEKGASEEVQSEFGGWYPTLLDTVLLSQGKHFVGTSGSTMSVLSLRRVLDWSHGLGRLVDAEGPSS